jgi:hypothetical protein
MALLDSIDDFRQHVALSASTDDDYFQQLQGDLLLAEEDYLRPAIGEAYEAVRDSATGRLRTLLQAALANLTMLSYLDVAQVQISGAGVQIISTEREKTAFPWQIDNLKASYAKKGFNGLEKVLGYLEENADTFPTWRDSATAQATRSHFLSSAAAFSQYYNISNARLTFQALASLLRKTEDFRLLPALGPEYSEELHQQLVKDELTPENAKLLSDYVRPALAHLAMAQAIGELGFSLNGQNLELNVYRPDDSNSKEADPGLTQLLDMKAHQALEDGERYLRRMVSHLNATASETRYPTYFSGSAYEKPAVPNYFVNDLNAKIFGTF